MCFHLMSSCFNVSLLSLQVLRMRSSERSLVHSCMRGMPTRNTHGVTMSCDLCRKVGRNGLALDSRLWTLWTQPGSWDSKMVSGWGRREGHSKWSNFNRMITTKYINCQEHHLRNGGHFVQGEMIWWQVWLTQCHVPGPYGTNTGTFWNNKVNTMATDAMAPCVTRSSATTVLTLQCKCSLVFYKEEFQLPASSQCWAKIRKCKYKFIFFLLNSALIEAE